MAEILLAGVLGAAVLAIVRLYKNGEKQAARLAKVEAEVAAEKIARITRRPASPPPSVDDEPEPVRRKRHLALYLGGCLAAFVASLGSRIRDLVRGRRTAAATIAASSVLVATSAVAYYANHGSDETSDSAGQTPAATAPDLGDSDDQTPEPDTIGDDGTDKNDTKQGANTAPALLDQSGIPDDEHPRPGASQSGDSGHGARTGEEPPGSDVSGAPTPTTPTETQPPVKSPAPRPTPEPEPSQPPTSQPPTDDKPGDDGPCIGLPPILELCLPGKPK